MYDIHEKLLKNKKDRSEVVGTAGRSLNGPWHAHSRSDKNLVDLNYEKAYYGFKAKPFQDNPPLKCYFKYQACMVCMTCIACIGLQSNMGGTKKTVHPKKCTEYYQGC